MSEINMNILFDQMTNLKIKPVEGLTPIQIGNMDLLFVIRTHNQMYGNGNILRFKRIELNKEDNQVDIIIE